MATNLEMPPMPIENKKEYILMKKEIYIIYDIDYMTLETANSKKTAEEILNSTPTVDSTVRVFKGVELKAIPMAKRTWEIEEEK